eukprot:3570373-Pleurochrysis_carterae.AAC.2
MWRSRAATYSACSVPLPLRVGQRSLALPNRFQPRYTPLPSSFQRQQVISSHEACHRPPQACKLVPL